MIELTTEQQQTLDNDPQTPLLDPRTRKTYVLVQAEVFARLKDLLGQQENQGFVEGAYRHAMEIFGRDGWNDPSMDVYDQLGYWATSPSDYGENQ